MSKVRTQRSSSRPATRTPATSTSRPKDPTSSSTSSSKPRVATGRSANPGVQGSRSSSPRNPANSGNQYSNPYSNPYTSSSNGGRPYRATTTGGLVGVRGITGESGKWDTSGVTQHIDISNPYGLRNEQLLVEERRFQQGRRDALEARRQNRIDEQRQQTFENNMRLRAEHRENLGLANQQRNEYEDRGDRRRQQEFANNMQRIESSRAWNNVNSNRLLERDRMKANSQDNLLGIMGQLAKARGDQAVAREQTLAGLVANKWDNETQRQRNWYDGYSNIANSFSGSNNSYRYWS